MSQYRNLSYVSCILILFMLPSVTLAQKIFEGQVVDKETESIIPGVTVKLLKDGKVTSTNDRGYYKLISTDSIPSDTLLFTSIGYRPLKLEVKAYQRYMFIELEASATQLKNVTVSNKKKKIPAINKFRMADIRESTNNVTIPFWAQRMLAVKMKAPKTHYRITNIKLGRREMDTNLYPSGKLGLPSPYTRFLIHIMAVDRTSGKPQDKIYYTKQVSLTDNSLMVDIDVNADDWVMDTDEFYLVVEWQRAPINEILFLDAEEVVRKNTRSGEQKLGDAPVYRLQYQPALVVFIDGTKFTAYYMDTPGVWQRYNEKIYSNDKIYDTHVALSAEISY